jgi:hypothetical protein
MKKSHRSIYVYGFVFLSALSFAGCNLANIKAEEKSANSNVIQVAVAAENDDKKPSHDSASAASQITSASVAGTYEYDTHKDGEGFDNELEIKEAGNGKLYVFLSGSYIYRVGETQSFHEAEGKGDAQLRGNTAKATLVDEEGNPCRATINFNLNEATVKIPDTCRFNIALDGVYKRVSAKSKEPVESKSPKNGEISFAELYDLVNDFDKHKLGERFVITDVPASKIATVSRADEFGNTSYKNLFIFEAGDDEGNVANGFMTSKSLVKNLEINAGHEPASLRVTAVLIESTGKFDVYRMSFVTKIEGLDENRAVTWTATGDDPTKIKFTH